MARTIEKLSPAKVQKAKAPGLYGDGAGLYLYVGPTGGKSWIYRFMLDGVARQMGLGPLHTIGLARARELAAECRAQRLAGADPIDARNAAKTARRADAAKAITFKVCAARYIKANRAGWRNAKHAAQWDTTLATYCYPVIGGLSVAAIDTAHVTRILEPIWATKPETASRVRGRVESILDYARTHRWRSGENPARWRGHLENVLPKRSRVRAVAHHAALPWQSIGAFMASLERQDGVPALALRFAVLTAARTGEALGARWSEIDAHVWTVPAVRTKAHREHRIPLSDSALAVLREVGKLRESATDGFVFPGLRPGKPLSEAALRQVLKRMGHAETPHGMRAAFSTWAAESGQASDLVEAALAHVVGDKTVVAYQRGDRFERRTRLMQQWAAFCGDPARGVVVQIGAAR